MILNYELRNTKTSGVSSIIDDSNYVQIQVLRVHTREVLASQNTSQLILGDEVREGVLRYI